MYLNDPKNIFLTSNRYGCHKTQNLTLITNPVKKFINIKVTKIVGFHLLVM